MYVCMFDLMCTSCLCVFMYVFMCMPEPRNYCGRLAEAMKHVFAMRLSLGDPAFSNTTGCISSMLSDSFMAGELS